MNIDSFEKNKNIFFDKKKYIRKDSSDKNLKYDKNYSTAAEEDYTPPQNPWKRPSLNLSEVLQRIGLAEKKTERVAKRLARAGVSSRREAESLIDSGRISVNGKVLYSPAYNVAPKDLIELDGEPIVPIEPTRIFLFHKPAGIITTHYDPEGRKTIFDLLPKDLPRLISVGRLDITTEGLILLTNDGELSRMLELPSTGWVRRYRARVHGAIDEQKLSDLKNGINVDGVFYGPIHATLESEKNTNSWLLIELQEGKNREVRNILSALNLEVSRLIRISYGPFLLGDIAPEAIVELEKEKFEEHLDFSSSQDATMNSQEEIGGDTKREYADRSKESIFKKPRRDGASRGYQGNRREGGGERGTQERGAFGRGKPFGGPRREFDRPRREFSGESGERRERGSFRSGQDGQGEKFFVRQDRHPSGEKREYGDRSKEPRRDGASRGYQGNRREGGGERGTQERGAFGRGKPFGGPRREFNAPRREFSGESGDRRERGSFRSGQDNQGEKSFVRQDRHSSGEKREYGDRSKESRFKEPRRDGASRGYQGNRREGGGERGTQERGAFGRGKPFGGPRREFNAPRREFSGGSGERRESGSFRSGQDNQGEKSFVRQDRHSSGEKREYGDRSKESRFKEPRRDGASRGYQGSRREGGGERGTQERGAFGRGKPFGGPRREFNAPRRESSGESGDRGERGAFGRGKPFGGPRREFNGSRREFSGGSGDRRERGSFRSGQDDGQGAKSFVRQDRHSSGEKREYGDRSKESRFKEPRRDGASRGYQGNRREGGGERGTQERGAFRGKPSGPRREFNAPRREFLGNSREKAVEEKRKEEE